MSHQHHTTAALLLGKELLVRAALWLPR